MSRHAHHPAHDWEIIGQRPRPTLVDDLPLFTAPIARSTDPTTSHAAAARVRARPATLAARLLAAYAASPDGLTDEEAAANAECAASGYWKRCSDLRSAGAIAPTGQTRVGAAGLQRDVCAITPTGRALVRSTTLE